MPLLLHGEDPGWDKAKVLSLVLRVSWPRIPGSPAPSTWVSYCLGWACPDRDYTSQVLDQRFQLTGKWKVEWDFQAVVWDVGAGVKGQMGESRAPLAERQGGKGDQSTQRPSPLGRPLSSQSCLSQGVWSELH